MDILKAYIVKKNKVLLPKFEIGVSGRSFWSLNRIGMVNMNSSILIEAKEEKACGYYLYGTDIPIAFCYEPYLKESHPDLKTCIGVLTDRWEIGGAIGKNIPDIFFGYDGKVIVDEEVLEWLEKEKNIESMKKVKEAAMDYGEQCIEVIKKLEELQIEKEKLDKMLDSSLESALETRSTSLVERNRELIKKYNI